MLSASRLRDAAGVDVEVPYRWRWRSIIVRSPTYHQDIVVLCIHAAPPCLICIYIYQTPYATAPARLLFPSSPDPARLRLPAEWALYALLYVTKET